MLAGKRASSLTHIIWARPPTATLDSPDLSRRSADTVSSRCIKLEIHVDFVRRVRGDKGRPITNPVPRSPPQFGLDPPPLRLLTLPFLPSTHATPYTHLRFQAKAVLANESTVQDVSAPVRCSDEHPRWCEVGERENKFIGGAGS